MVDHFGLQDKVVAVIGGGLGMGQASCEALASVGARACVIDIDPERADNVAAKIRAAGGQAEAFTADVLANDGPASCAAAVVERCGRIDGLVTIVGQAKFGPFLDMTREDWELDHRRNLAYFAFCAQAFARQMVAQGDGGAITAIASVSGTQSAPNHAAYGAAKAGLINLVRSMAVELAPHGIRVNAISPGSIRTPRLSSPEMAKVIAESLVPFKRQGRTDEIASAVLFLTSQMASYVTGHNLCVDGGFMAQYILGELKPS